MKYNKKEVNDDFFLNGGAEVTKFELIINKFIEKIKSPAAFGLIKIIDSINKKIAA